MNILSRNCKLQMTFWAFKLFPSMAFCTSPLDPCSCTGGGFGIYGQFCNTKMVRSGLGNKTQIGNKSMTPSPDLVAMHNAKRAYTNIFEALSGDVGNILVSIGALALVFVIFSFARVYISYIKANDGQIAAEAEARSLMEVNLNLKSQLQSKRLSKAQIRLIEKNAPEMHRKIPSHYNLHWRALKLCVRLC